MQEGEKFVCHEEKNPLLDEVRQDPNPEEGHEKRLARYSIAKKRQRQVTDYILSQYDGNGNIPYRSELESLLSCGNDLWFRYYFALEKPQYRMIAGCTCKKHLLCSLCAIRRAAKCISVYHEKIKQVQADQDFDFVFITFTVKNGPDLSERYNHLRDSFKKMLQRRKDSLRITQKDKSLFRFIEGAIFSYEVTFNNESEEYHPHLHMIALIKKGTFEIHDGEVKGKPAKLLPELWAGLVQDWKEVTVDSFIVDVQLINDEEEKMSSLVETFKYALKFSEMPVAVQLECYRILKTRRMIGAMGALYGVTVPENLSDELLPGEKKYIDLVYQYSGIAGYQLTTHGKIDIDVSNLSQRFKPKSRRSADQALSEAELLEKIRNKASIKKRQSRKNQSLIL